MRLHLSVFIAKWKLFSFLATFSWFAYSLTELFTWIWSERWRKQISNIFSLLSLLSLSFLHTHASLLSNTKKVPIFWFFPYMKDFADAWSSCLCWTPSPPTMALGRATRPEECFVRRGKQDIQWWLCCLLFSLCHHSCERFWHVRRVLWRSLQHLEFWPSVWVQNPAVSMHTPQDCACFALAGIEFSLPFLAHVVHFVRI